MAIETRAPAVSTARNGSFQVRMRHSRSFVSTNDRGGQMTATESTATKRRMGVNEEFEWTNNSGKRTGNLDPSGRFGVSRGSRRLEHILRRTQARRRRSSDPFPRDRTTASNMVGSRPISRVVFRSQRISHRVHYIAKRPAQEPTGK